ncbi:MAG TPA: TonB family protein [Paludibaculum sp.]|jgi:TonB family protein
MKSTMTGFVCLLASLGFTPLLAETLNGTVYDVSGAAIPNVVITITNAETKLSRTLASGEDGSFSAVGIAPGAYQLTFEAKGFQAAREHTSLKAGETAKLTPVLQVGRIRETMTVTAKGTPAYSGPVKVRVGGNVEPPKLLREVRAPYPESVKARGITGTVIVQGVLLMDGTLSSLRVIQSPDPELSASTLEAVSKARYTPAKLNGQPIEVVTVIEINFNLAP